MSTRGGLSDDRFYDRLDPDKVSDTLIQLQGRILEQFPHRHLAQVATIGEYIDPWLRETGYDPELVDQLVILRSGGSVQLPGRIRRLRARLGLGRTGARA